MARVTRRELMKGAAAGLGAAAVASASGALPASATGDEAALVSDMPMGARIRIYRRRLGLP